MKLRRVVITSFRKCKKFDLPHYSIAVYQPKGFSLEKAGWADIRRNGKWTLPREFVAYPEPLQAYRDALWGLYLERENEIKDWLGSIREKKIALCCWCPYERAAQRQLKQFGSFVCHSAVVGKFLSERLGLVVEYDKDRRKMVRF